MVLVFRFPAILFWLCGVSKDDKAPTEVIRYRRGRIEHGLGTGDYVRDRVPPTISLEGKVEGNSCIEDCFAQETIGMPLVIAWHGEIR